MGVISQTFTAGRLHATQGLDIRLVFRQGGLRELHARHGIIGPESGQDNDYLNMARVSCTEKMRRVSGRYLP